MKTQESPQLQWWEASFSRQSVLVSSCYIAAYIFEDMLKSFCAAQDFMCVSVCTHRLLFLSILKVCWSANPTSKKVSMDTFRFRFLISWLRDKCPLSKLKANLFLRRKTLFPMYYAPTPCSRKWPPTPVFLPGESHGQRSLEGYSPWGHKESDITERLTHRVPIWRAWR